MRLLGVGNSNNVVERDHIYSKRWGLVISVAFKFNDKINYVIQFMHQQDDSVPDYGIPILMKPRSNVAKSMSEYGAKRSNWYGRKEIDRDQTQDNQLTASLFRL